MDYKLVIKDIESGKFEKIYFLHGEEAFFIDVISDAIIKNAMDETDRDFNQSIYYGKDTDINNLIADARGYPMGPQRRVVILKEAQDFKNIDELDMYFSAPSETTVFVVCYKYKKFDTRKKLIKSAAANGLVFKSDKIPDYKLVEWVNAYVKNSGYGITPKAAMLLAEFLGNDLGRIVNELEKLHILVEKGTVINEIHVEENIGISKDYNVFELVNAVAVRDVSKANKIVDYFNHNPKAGPLIVVVSNLFAHFSKLMRIHFLENKSRDAIANALKVHPFVAGELLNSSKIYNPKKLAANIAILHEYDLKSKGIDNVSFEEGQLMKELLFKLLN